MCKKTKEHRKKVTKRNAVLKQKKLNMQKAFDMLIQQQIENTKNKENLKVEGKNQDLNFEIIEDRNINNTFNFIPNEEESAKIDQEFIETNEEELNKINQEFEPEFNGASNTIEDREIDVDTDMEGEFVKYEEVKNTFPANVEGTEEFNMSNTEQ